MGQVVERGRERAREVVAGEVELSKLRKREDDRGNLARQVIAVEIQGHELGTVGEVRRERTRKEVVAERKDFKSSEVTKDARGELSPEAGGWEVDPGDAVRGAPDALP